MVVIIPDEWHTYGLSSSSGSTLASPVVVLGSKGVGKSSFVKFLCDKQKSSEKSVCVLETDCGQPELTAPGLLSLAVYSASGKRQIISQRFLGFVNPASDPRGYIKGIELVLCDFRASEFANLPLLVNCHGWSNGAGVETWVAIIALVGASTVVHVGGNSDTNGELDLDLESGLLPDDTPLPSPTWLAIPSIVVIDESPALKKSNVTSSDKRWVKFASHFRPDLVHKNVFKASPLSEFFCDPFVKFLTLDRASTAISGVPADDSVLAIERTIVGLCDSTSGQCVCLGYVWSFTDSSVLIAIPPNIPALYGGKINQIVRGSMNWSPREAVCHNNKTTSCDYTTSPEGEPYFLPNVLVGDELGARVPSSRTNLKRRRLQPAGNR